ncbi:MAG: PhoH family protein [Bacteroidetes bacterium]|nr:PhoH family protein [Bacteroidota bacterium]
MNEKTIILNSVNPIDIYGVNDTQLEAIKKQFPKLKIIARGETLKLIGDEQEIAIFESKLTMLIDYVNRYGKLTETNIEEIVSSVNDTAETPINSNDVLVFGNGGLIIKPKTKNQRKLVESCRKNDIVFAIGPAGTGKTYTAVALAVQALKNKQVRKIILTRPAVEAGENLGFLPGDLKEKLDPYLQPLYDALHDMIPADKLAYYLETRVIQIAPLAFMRGRTLDHAFVILDEAQNATEGQLKMFLTRMGSSAKFVITGDVTQVDLPKHQKSGLSQAMRLFKNVDGIDFVLLNNSDVIRHRLVKSIIEIYEKESNN